MADLRTAHGWHMIICNPISGAGRGRAILERVQRSLDQAEIPYRAEVTRKNGDAAHMARAAVSAGCGVVVAIGGDGTLFEVVNGVMGDRALDGGRRQVSIGLVQAGRGSDFGRSAGIPSDVEAACARIVQGRTQTIDLGQVRFRGFDGHVSTRYFANAAGLGFDAEVALRSNSMPRLAGGTVSYLSSLVLTLGTYRNKRMNIRVDGSLFAAGRANSVVVANGQYFGGGMKIAPNAQLGDGLLDVVLLGNLSKPDLIVNVPRVYSGSHLSHPKVRSASGSEVDVESPERVLLQADGEVLGTVPAHFSVAGSALRLIV